MTDRVINNVRPSSADVVKWNKLTTTRDTVCLF